MKSCPTKLKDSAITLRSIVGSEIQRQRFWVRHRRAEKRLDPKVSAKFLNRVMVVVSTGRTGTSWLAKLLKSAEQAPTCTHEPVFQEQFAMNRGAYDRVAALRYAHYRVRDIAQRLKDTRSGLYIEVNGALRRHVLEIKSIAPEIYMPLIIRDGREVVSSVMNRTSGSIKDPFFQSINPRVYGISRLSWYRMDRFERLCYVWTFDNEYMLRHCDAVIRMEDMIGDFTRFEDVLCKPLSLMLDRRKWEIARLSSENGNSGNGFPSWTAWSRENQDIFARVCGPTMAKFGYSFESAISRTTN